MLQVVADILRRRASKGWLVGGGVRDLELGRFSACARMRVDLDIVVMDDPRAVAREIARSLDVPWFVLSERHPAYRVMGSEGHVDVAAVRGAGILDDLAERDFTVNAMAVPIVSDAFTGAGGTIDPTVLIDPFDGLRHLREKRLVAVSGRIFTDDPLRMMRAVRFHHVFGLRLDAALCESIRGHAPLLAATAAERITAELALTLAEGRTGEAVACWDDLGLLKAVLPESRLWSAPAALAMLARLDRMLEAPATLSPELADRLSERLARPVDGALSRPVALRLAALTRGLDPDEAARVGRRLKLSGEVVSLVAAAARVFRQDPGAADAGSVWPSLPAAGPPGRDAVLFLWRCAPWEPEVILLAAAGVAATDAAASADVLEDRSQTLEPARRLLSLWARRMEGCDPPLPVDGTLLMRRLGLSSGPRLGAALREVRLSWEAGEISTFDEALAVARSCSACEP